MQTRQFSTMKEIHSPKTSPATSKIRKNAKSSILLSRNCSSAQHPQDGRRSKSPTKRAGVADARNGRRQTRRKQAETYNTKLSARLKGTQRSLSLRCSSGVALKSLARSSLASNGLRWRSASRVSSYRRSTAAWAPMKSQATRQCASPPYDIVARPCRRETAPPWASA